MLRWFALVWAVVCVIIAFMTSADMLITFAPSPVYSGETASAELAGIERVRWFWARGVWMTSVMLVISAVTLVVCTWHRKRFKHD